MLSNANSELLLPAINFHLWQPCNMRCRFCFATFQDVKQSCLPKGHLHEKEAVAVVEALCRAGVGKITFAGGEPTLCPWLPQLLHTAKSYGITTMVVTNGSRITPAWLQEYVDLVDWITLSVDSVDPTVNELSGRKQPGQTAPDIYWYLNKARDIREAGIRLKINTVVHRLNHQEDLSPLIKSAEPERWKLFQVLPVRGQNDGKVESLEIDSTAFQDFVERHRQLLPQIKIIPESNDAMTSSYLMVDPAGRFFDNQKGRHTYGRPILDVGVKEALSEVFFDLDKFKGRDGVYEW